LSAIKDKTESASSVAPEKSKDSVAKLIPEFRVNSSCVGKKEISGELKKKQKKTARDDATNQMATAKIRIVRLLLRPGARLMFARPQF
jgi:hypothetical protein